MVTRKKFLWEHPSGRWYVRRAGRYQRVYAEYGTAEFDFEYWEIMRGRATEVKCSWSILILELRRSDKWGEFSPRYRQDLEKVLQYLDARIGKRDVSRLMPSDIYAAMENNRHRVRFANYIPTTISLLVKIARKKGWRKDNPAADIEQMKVPKERKKPHVAWPNTAVNKMRKKSKGIPLLIFEIGISSVQRPGDWVGFTWGDYDGDTLKLTQNKTGIKLLLLCTKQLKHQLKIAKKAFSAEPEPTRSILAKADGSAMSYYTMARVMRAERERLGFTEYDLHALRYRGVKELAYAGCDDHEIAAFSGHMTIAMIQKYAGEARQEMRARSANAKRENA